MQVNTKLDARQAKLRLQVVASQPLVSLIQVFSALTRPVAYLELREHHGCVGLRTRARSCVSLPFGHVVSSVICLTHCFCSRLCLIFDDVYVFMLLFYSLILFVVHPPLFYQKRPVAIFSRLGSLCQPEDASAVAIMSCSFSCFCTILCVMMSQLCHSERPLLLYKFEIVYL